MIYRDVQKAPYRHYSRIGVSSLLVDLKVLTDVARVCHSHVLLVDYINAILYVHQDTTISRVVECILMGEALDYFVRVW